MPDLYTILAGSPLPKGGAQEVGNKAWGLLRMVQAGLPIPPAFVLPTAWCQRTQAADRPAMRKTLAAGITHLQSATGLGFGASRRPLLVSVRSGGAVSMPGMMETVLNIGLNAETVEALIRLTGNPRLAWDSYRRLVQSYAEVVAYLPTAPFDALVADALKSGEVDDERDLDHRDLRTLTVAMLDCYRTLTGNAFPADPREQLAAAAAAVFRSWDATKAVSYRRLNGIDDKAGTAVTVQTMVFGNAGGESGAGVAFTRNPAIGTNELYFDFQFNAQGEDVVSGIRTPLSISELERAMPMVYDHLRAVTWKMEKHYRDMQDFEFTIQDGKLYMLQTRNGKRTGLAAVRIAIDMVREGLITQEEAIFRVEPNQLYDFLVPRLIEKGEKVEVLATGLPASPGAAVGQIVFSAEDAVKFHQSGAYRVIILVRGETTPEDIAGMEVAAGILTSRGGMTSHAAVVTRGMGKCCVAGAGDCTVDLEAKELRVKGHVFRQGDWISLDGTTGRVIAGQLKTLPAQPDDPDLVKFMSWVDPVRRLKIRANADVPRDAKQARLFGAEGIGLCRTEHMFFAEDRIGHVRAMILSDNEKDRRAALHKLLPMQRADFVGLFKTMESLPVTIRLLDPPLHEFLPQREDLLVEISHLEDTKPRSPRLKELRPLLARVQELHETNPMLGLRGCRLGIAFPEITEMQSRAIFEAAVAVKNKGGDPHLEIMVPLIGSIEEMRHQAAIVRRVAADVFKEKGETVDYMVGTMIELPRAALTADQIAEEAEFFSFGTNDLTQTTFGISRDDINHFLPAYMKAGIFKQDPFATLDQAGVGLLVKMATAKGRNTRPTLKVGICGEHGGDPESVKFCHKIGLNYVSCSPYRLLTARLAAAQAALEESSGINHTNK